jgi:hypothetical protein
VVIRFRRKIVPGLHPSSPVQRVGFPGFHGGDLLIRTLLLCKGYSGRSSGFTSCGKSAGSAAEEGGLGSFFLSSGGSSGLLLGGSSRLLLGLFLLVLSFDLTVEDEASGGESRTIESVETSPFSILAEEEAVDDLREENCR